MNLIDKSAKISNFTNIYGATIGNNCFIGPFTEIQCGVIIGSRCRVQSHSFICEGVIIEDDVFIGHGVMFSNDKFPKANNPNWICQETVVKKNASIGNGCTILPGVEIGENALIGAGSVVTKNVPSGQVWFGNPAKSK